jgi:hypothetical protein
LKLNNSKNIGGATSATKIFTFADGEGVINVEENLKEVSDRETFKHVSVVFWYINLRYSYDDILICG